MHNLSFAIEGTSPTCTRIELPELCDGFVDAMIYQVLTRPWRYTIYTRRTRKNLAT